MVFPEHRTVRNSFPQWTQEEQTRLPEPGLPPTPTDPVGPQETKNQYFLAKKPSIMVPLTYSCVMWRLKDNNPYL